MNHGGFRFPWPILWALTVGLVPGGCEAPKKSPPSTRAAQSGGGDLIPLDTAEPRYRPAAEWRPDSGRLSAYLRERHGHDSPGALTVIFDEDFERSSATGETAWRVVGKVKPRLPRSTGQPGGAGRYLELGRSEEGDAHGLAWDLPPARLSGRVVRCRVRTYLPRLLPVRRVGMPTIRFVFCSPRLSREIVTWPLTLHPSPGWETQEFLCKVPAELESATLEALQVGSSIVIGLDDLRVEQFDSLIGTAAPPVAEAGGNLVINGDFEVGQKGFSVYGVRRFPDGRRGIVPHAWFLDHDAPVHRSCLLVPLRTDQAWVEFACLRPPARVKSFMLSLQLRAARPVRVEASLTDAAGRLGAATFPASDTWRSFQELLSVTRPAQGLARLAIKAQGKPERAGSAEPSHLWIDAVALYAAGNPVAGYRAASDVEVGVLGPAPDPVDLAHLIEVGQAVSFAARIINHAQQPFRGTLAIDVVDAFDRLVWTKTSEQTVAPGDMQELPSQLHLPRGYYRILATAWPGRIGHGRPGSRAERAFGVVNLSDAVPRGSPFGFVAGVGRLSRRLTQLGGGWVRFLAAPPSGNGPAVDWLSESLSSAARARLETVVAINQVPREESERRRFLGALVSAAANGGAAIEIAAHDDPDLTSGEYLEFFNACAADITRLAPRLKIAAPSRTEPIGAKLQWLRKCVNSGLPTALAALTIRLPPFRPPEQVESVLEDFAALATQKASQHRWDVEVPAHAGTAYLYVPRGVPSGPRLRSIWPARSDPALEASELVRSLAIRYLAGIERACCGLFSHQPLDILNARSHEALNEYDNAPKPAVVAFDLFAEMLNDAYLAEWIDLRRDVRALCFEKSDGGGVALIWRPFGASIEWYLLPGWSNRARAVNCFGQPERNTVANKDLRVPVSAMVRYLLVEPDARSAFFHALRTATPVEAPAAR